MADNCSAQIRDQERGGWRSHYRACTNKATVLHEGKPFCGVHNPAAKKARHAKADEKYEAKLRVAKARNNVIAAALRHYTGDDPTDEALRLATIELLNAQRECQELGVSLYSI